MIDTDQIWDTSRSLGPVLLFFCCICTCIAIPHMNGQYQKYKMKDDDQYKAYRTRPKFLSEGGKTYKKVLLNDCQQNDDGSYQIFTGRGPFVMKQKKMVGDSEDVSCGRGWLESISDGFAPYDCYCALKSAGT